MPKTPIPYYREVGGSIRAFRGVRPNVAPICMHKNIRICLSLIMKVSLLLAGLPRQATRLKLLIPMQSHPVLADQSILLEANSISVFFDLP
jgi:hypothetical protein